MAALLVIVQLIFLEGILSLDNAAVLGAMAASLPADRSVPWPKWMAPFGHRLDRLLGPQRQAALRVGLFGAYAGRTLMLVLAAWVVQNPWLKLVGALYLLKLAAEHLSQPSHESESGAPQPKDGRFWRVVLSIELADLAFSLDNVVAAVALSRHLAIVILGVAIGILTMRFAAGIFANLVTREPILAPTAFILILNISVELLLEDFAGAHFGDLTKFAISAGTIALALLYAHWSVMHVIDPLLRAAKWVLGLVNKIMDGIFYPFKLVLMGIASLTSGTVSRVHPPAG
ncbi:MAG: tellurium resistance protein TerC [Chloroflexi bacterium]|nr:tellurium resistance protein TerC [Chloroflexota bacterium]